MTLSQDFPHRRSVLDSLHGLIALSDEEVELIDHPLFQRLHGVRQNGLLHLVFPSANHTRLEHSIGVLHVVTRMIDSLLLNSAVAAAKIPSRVVPPEDEVKNVAVNLATVDKGAIQEFTKIARFAALAHDLGHGPLSHAFGPFAPRAASFENWFAHPAVRRLEPIREAILRWINEHDNSTPQRVPHEVMSCIFFALCCADTSLGDDAALPVEVACVILGIRVPDTVAVSLPVEWYPLGHDLIASAPADADRMDYLERDSRSIGVSYGLYDRNRLQKSMLAYRDDKGSLRLGLKKSGLPAVENFVQARFELFYQIYYHKTNKAIELMLEEIGKVSAGKENPLIDDSSVEAIVADYLKLDDFEMMRRLRSESQIPRLGALASEISSRRLWKRVKECSSKAEAMSCIAHLEAKHPRAVLREDAQEVKATKDLETGAVLLERNHHGRYVATQEADWVKASNIIQALRDKENSLFRVYLENPEPELLADVRESALSDCPSKEATP